MKKIDYKIIFIDYCIHKFAEKYNFSPQQAYIYLDQYKGIDFIDECYEAEHQLSLEDAVCDLATICHNNGGNLI